MRILALIRVLEGATIQVFAYGLLHNAASDSSKIPTF
jgi:hypothetical protein